MLKDTRVKIMDAKNDVICDSDDSENCIDRMRNFIDYLLKLYVSENENMESVPGGMMEQLMNEFTPVFKEAYHSTVTS